MKVYAFFIKYSISLLFIFLSWFLVTCGIILFKGVLGIDFRIGFLLTPMLLALILASIISYKKIDKPEDFWYYIFKFPLSKAFFVNSGA